MAGLGEGPGGPDSPPPLLILVKKKRKETAEGREACRESDKKPGPPSPLAQGEEREDIFFLFTMNAKAFFSKFAREVLNS